MLGEGRRGRRLERKSRCGGGGEEGFNFIFINKIRAAPHPFPSERGAQKILSRAEGPSGRREGGKNGAAIAAPPPAPRHNGCSSSSPPPPPPPHQVASAPSFPPSLPTPNTGLYRSPAAAAAPLSLPPRRYLQRHVLGFPVRPQPAEQLQGPPAVPRPSAAAARRVPLADDDVQLGHLGRARRHVDVVGHGEGGNEREGEEKGARPVRAGGGVAFNGRGASGERERARERAR